MNRDQTRRSFLAHSAGAVGLIGVATSQSWNFARAYEAPSANDLITAGVNFLKPRQDADGSWSSTRKEPGLTALVLVALLKSGQVTPSEPVVAKGLAYLERFIGPKGGLSEAAHANYTTAIGLLAFQEANKRSAGRYDSVIKGCQTFLKEKQWDETEGKLSDDVFYGGAGYGGSNSRPDLSNTAFMIEALHDSGLSANDPALKRALIFVSRCQNLKSEFNDQPWADKVNDGGFIYTAAQGGTSMAGKDDGGGLRSYAAMTYAGLKSMIYAGLGPDDPRVKAALDYIKKHYSLDENPGLGKQGLYYYYHTFAKTMATLGQPAFVDDAGKSHDWKSELVAALAQRQEKNGSWVNPADRFMEGDANLVTAYALLALNYAK